MKIRIQSQLLSAMLVLSAISAPVLPTYAAAAPTSISADAARTGTVVTNDTALMTTVTDLIGKKDLKGAMEAVNQAISANPSNATAYLCKAFVLFYTENSSVAEILEPLNTAISIAPNYIDALLTRGNVLEITKDLQGAVKDFDAVIALDKTNVEAMNHSTDIKTTLQDWAGLIANFNIRIENNQNDAHAYFDRAYCEYELGQKDLAVADLQKAQSLFVAANDQDGAKAVADALSELQKTA